MRLVLLGVLLTLFCLESKLQADETPKKETSDAQTATGSCAEKTNPATTCDIFYTLIGGVEQAGLSARPSETEPFARFFIQSVKAPKVEGRLWLNLRLLGSPNQSDTRSIFSVFTDPTGQITTEKLSSVGAAVDATVGAAYRLSPRKNGTNSVDLIVGFGFTTPFESDKVTQAFVVPVFGTSECNTLVSKFKQDLANPNFAVQQSKDGVGTGTTTACLLNTAAATTANGVTTYAPISTLAFASQDRTSFLLKDVFGVRLNHTLSGKCEELTCAYGSFDFTVGNDASVTGGVLRGNRLIAKADGLYPIVTGKNKTFYIFGSFSTRFSRNKTDNTPLILQAASLSL